MIIPEDDANRQIASGFELEVPNGRHIQVLPEAGGWTNVFNDFLQNHQLAMNKYSMRHIVLLLDFDNQSDRRMSIEEKLAPTLRHRVYLLGVRSEPEALVQAGFGSLEAIGRRLGADCRNGLWGELWRNELLSDNAVEFERLKANVRPFLFDPVL